MANNYKRWLCEESLKTPLLVTHFEFRGKPSLITVICMNYCYLHGPSLAQQNTRR